MENQTDEFKITLNKMNILFDRKKTLKNNCKLNSQKNYLLNFFNIFYLFFYNQKNIFRFPKNLSSEKIRFHKR